MAAGGLAGEVEGSSLMNLHEEHQIRHEALHQAFDELIADYLAHNPDKLPSTTTCVELMVWSHQQTLNPTDQCERFICAWCGEEIEHGHECDITSLMPTEQTERVQ